MVTFVLKNDMAGLYTKKNVSVKDVVCCYFCVDNVHIAMCCIAMYVRCTHAARGAAGGNNKSKQIKK